MMFKRELPRSQKQLEQQGNFDIDTLVCQKTKLDVYRQMEESGREMSTEEEVELIGYDLGGEG